MLKVWPKSSQFSCHKVQKLFLHCGVCFSNRKQQWKNSIFTLCPSLSGRMFDMSLKLNASAFQRCHNILRKLAPLLAIYLLILTIGNTENLANFIESTIRHK